MANVTIGDNNYLCVELNASFIGDLVGDPKANGTAGGINLTALVDYCENTCQIAWGSPNPDLSGIGVTYNSTHSLSIP